MPFRFFLYSRLTTVEGL